MRILNTFVKDLKKTVVLGDGGSYKVEMYINAELIDTKVFNEHTLRIVENYAKEWIEK
jgi:hypothetical protein